MVTSLRDQLFPYAVTAVLTHFPTFATVLAVAVLAAIILARGWRRRPRVLAGKAYVTDGDGLRVQGREVRFAALDAPEWDQRAKHQDGYWFAHGKRVKSALIQKIGGRRVKVKVESWDKFGRAVGTVLCEGRDIGEWLVREGHAIAAYGDRYRKVERQARKDKRGMWAHERNIDPRVWRHAVKKPADNPSPEQPRVRVLGKSQHNRRSKWSTR